ncbi:MAG TPA: ubiquitin-like small modifier protein 1 [Longimicrobiales bacterium]
MALIRIPAALRDYTSGAAEMAVAGESVGVALDRLLNAYPQLRRHLYTERGELRSYVNVFVNENDVRTLAGLQTQIADGDTLMIVPSIAGG